MPSLLPSPRCALTAPFHPYRPSAAVAFKALAVKGLGGLLSVALSVGSRPPGVTWHPIRRSPDFPPPRLTLTAFTVKSSRNSDCPAGSPGDTIGPAGKKSICSQSLHSPLNYGLHPVGGARDHDVARARWCPQHDRFLPTHPCNAEPRWMLRSMLLVPSSFSGLQQVVSLTPGRTGQLRRNRRRPPWRQLLRQQLHSAFQQL